MSVLVLEEYASFIDCRKNLDVLCFAQNRLQVLGGHIFAAASMEFLKVAFTSLENRLRRDCRHMVPFFEIDHFQAKFEKDSFCDLGIVERVFSGWSYGLKCFRKSFANAALAPLLKGDRFP